MTEATSKKLILEFLRANPVMNIAVVDGDKPITSVVLFAVDDDFTFYFASRSNSFKTKALLKNNKISFSVWKNQDMLIQGDGTATLAPVQQGENLLYKLALSSTNIEDFWPPILSIVGGDYTLFMLKPTWLRSLNLKDLKIHEAKDPFVEIELT